MCQVYGVRHPAEDDVDRQEQPAAPTQTDALHKMAPEDRG